MRNRRSQIIGVVLTLAAAAVVFLLSQQSGEHSDVLSRACTDGLLALAAKLRLDGPVRGLLNALDLRKMAHVGLFLLLGVFLSLVIPCRSKGKKAVICLIAGLFLAVGDEIHQMYVPGRTARLSDVGIDLMGVAMGVGLTYGIRAVISRKRAGDDGEE